MSSSLHVELSLKNSHSRPRSSSPAFSFVESSISRILRLDKANNDNNALLLSRHEKFRALVVLDPSTGLLTLTTANNCSNSGREEELESETTPRILLEGGDDDDNVEDPTPPLTVHDLVPLAIQCDTLLFQEASDDDKNTQQHSTAIRNMRQSPLIQIVVAKQGMNQNNDANCTQHDDGSSSASSSWAVTSTLLALNALESAVRQAAGFSTAKAPLLTTMLQTLAKTPENGANENHDATTISKRRLVVQVLQLLLLPTGLNLRNLLWHGFVADSLPRPWLALVVMLQHQVQSLWRMVGCSAHGTDDDTAGASLLVVAPDDKAELPVALRHLSSVHPRLKAVVMQGRAIRQAASAIQDKDGGAGDDDGDDASRSSRMHLQTIGAWLPVEHQSLWKLLCTDKLLLSSSSSNRCGCPWITSALLLVLLEHGLRLDWCLLHHCPQDAMARPGQFYVTLDGHGQRDKHNLLLHPFVYDSFDHNNNNNNNDGRRAPNQLSRLVGANTVALLTDLLVSPTGPNVRACLSHGLLDGHLERELQSLLRKPNANTPSFAPPGGADDVMSKNEDDDDSRHHHWDIVDALLLAMARVASASLAVRQLSPSRPRPTTNSNTMSSDRSTAAAAVVSSSAAAALQSYRPVFSYTAVTIQRLASLRHQLLGRLQGALERHEKLLQSAAVQSVLRPPQAIMAQVGGRDSMETSFSHCKLQSNLDTLMRLLGGCNNDDDETTMTTNGEEEASEWTVDHLFAEHETNRQLAQLGATRLLLLELAQAVSGYVDGLEAAVVTLQQEQQEETDDTTTGTVGNRRRARRRSLRVLATARPAWWFFSVSAQISLALLTTSVGAVAASPPVTTTTTTVQQQQQSRPDGRRNNGELVKAVKRTRMVLSTVDTYLFKNTERAFQAMETYAKGKVIQQVLNHL